jgi:arylsulfatase A-like enzyme
MNIKKYIRWLKLTELTILSIYLYFGLEWIFFATKPSFLNALPFLTQLSVLAFAGVVFFGMCAVVVLLLYGVNLLVRRAAVRVLLGLGALIPSLFFTCAGLMALDNFTYTLFKFGIVKTDGIGRGLYWVVFLLGLGGCLFWVIRSINRQKRLDSDFRGRLVFAGLLVCLSIPLSVSLLVNVKSEAAVQLTGSARRHPNILLIGTDGLNASHMSLYGYNRDTTPFLKELANTSLLSENNFPNATVTAGSLVSIFTDKLPTTTHMLYPPDILRGSDAYQHLPGLLKSAGYFNADITVDYYGNATELNMQNSFSIINGRPLVSGKLYDLLRRIFPENESYFLSVLGTRLSERVEHIFYIHTMADPYAEVTEEPGAVTDMERVEQILYTFRYSPQPLFLHVHMMGTHKGNLHARNDTFTQGKKYESSTEMDYYDDTILDFDGYMNQVIDGLSRLGVLDNTVIILYTDHGFSNVSNQRIPLMFHFPGDENAGRLSNNTQNLDIAPTLLDYLGIPQPAWMAGQSLLKGEPAKDRPIFSAAPGDRSYNEFGRMQMNTSQLKPPFYQFGIIGMVVCQKFYALDTKAMTWQVSDIQNYPAPCDIKDLPDDQQVRQMMLKQLKTDGFQMP